MDSARKNAGLGWSPPGFIDTDASRIDAEFVEEVDQLESVGIIPYYADRQRHCAQGMQVVYGVCAAAWNKLAVALIEDQHRASREMREISP
jgi:hypothetical protein